MSTGAVVRARIDADVKVQAAEVLAQMGLTLSDAVRVTLTRIAREKTFCHLIPNQATIDAIEAAEKGEVTAVTIEQMREWISETSDD